MIINNKKKITWLLVDMKDIFVYKKNIILLFAALTYSHVMFSIYYNFRIRGCDLYIKNVYKNLKFCTAIQKKKKKTAQL